MKPHHLRRAVPWIVALVIVTSVTPALFRDKRDVGEPWAVVTDGRGHYNFSWEDSRVNRYVADVSSFDEAYERMILTKILQDRIRTNPFLQEQPVRKYKVCRNSAKGERL